MKVNCIVAIPTYNQHDHLYRNLLPSIFSGTVMPDSLFIWDNGNCSDQWLANNAVQYDATIPVTLVLSEENVGLSRAWNAAMAYGKQEYGAEEFVVIQSNDDVVFEPTTLETLLNAYKANPTCGFYYPTGATSGNSFSLFLLSRTLWESVGPFDEDIVRAYFEDNDYHRRMTLFDPMYTHLQGVPGSNYTHVGSATVKKMSQDKTQQLITEKIFRRNEAYFIAKWGGKPGQETYTLPFNGDIHGVDKFNATYRWE